MSRLPLAVRAFTDRRDAEARGSEHDADATSGPRGWNWPRHVLVFDTETATDYSQRLNFGSWRFYQLKTTHDRIAATCLEEGLFYGDDLPERYPAGFAELATFVDSTAPDVDRSAPDAAWQMTLLPAREFAHQLVELGFRGSTWIVGFNLPFDLSRLAYHASEADPPYLPGGFALTLVEHFDEKKGWLEHRWRNRIAIKTLDSKRNLIGFKRRLESDPSDDHRFKGHFLDLRTLAFALTNKRYSLQGAMRDYVDPDYAEPDVKHGVIDRRMIEYNRQDVWATGALFEALIADYRRHPIDLIPTKAYSPATIGKAYLKAMDVAPRLERQPGFSPEVLGQAMVAYYGGRAECRIRRTPVPVVYVDFLSMYPTVNSLMGLWDFVTADAVNVDSGRDVAAEVTRLLDELSLEDTFDPNVWPGFVGLAEIEPAGDVLPVRARYGDNKAWGIGVNPLSSKWPLWYSIADLAAAKLLHPEGRTPRIRQALRFVARGQGRLSKTRLRGAVEVDPATEDFFRTVIEQRHLVERRSESSGERKRLDSFLKVLANSASYGIYAEMVRHELGRNKTEPVDVYGLEQFIDPAVRHPESVGKYAFPPLAACITGAARLMLAILERTVSDAGGSYAFCDTDSMAIVASEAGGPVACKGGQDRLADNREAVRALTWTDVDAICKRFERLNPYDRDAVRGSVLEIEDENFDDHGRTRQRQLYCYAISAKRYALFTINRDGEPILQGPTDDRVGEKWSEHGLGHVLNPVDPGDHDRDWIRALWQRELQVALDRPSTDPEWLSRPAVGQLTVAKPQTLDPFATFNADSPYSHRIKPFNFLLTAQLPELVASPDGVDPLRFQLITPYEKDARRWLQLRWRNKYASDQAELYRVTTSDGPCEDNVVRIQSFRDLADEYRVRPEPKSLSPSGRRSGWHADGLLLRRPVTASRIVHIGKESNELEESIGRTVHDQAEVLNEHVTVNTWKRYVLPTLAALTRKQLRELGLSGATIKAVRAEAYHPTDRTMARLTEAAGAFARDSLRTEGVVPPGDPVDCCAAYLGR